MYKTTNYTITRENLPIHELIGLEIEVVRSRDATKKGIAGTIVDETQRTFTIETPKGEKIVPKNESTFSFDLNGEIVRLAGNELAHSPIERLKTGGKAHYA